MFSLFKRNNSVVGIDIGSSSVKLLELSAIGHDGYKVECYATLPLPATVIVDREVKDVQALIGVLQQVFEHTHIKAPAAALAMPNSLVITKNIKMESGLSDAEIQSTLELDAGRYIPYPLEEVSFDFSVVKQGIAGESKSEVMMIASRTEHVDTRVDAVEDAGLPVSIVDVESYALEHAAELIMHQLPSQSHDKIIAIVNIGAEIMSITVLQDMQIIYTREETFGGKQLTEKIASNYDMNYEQAEFAKINNGLPPEYKEELLEPFKEAIVMEVEHALQFFYSSGAHESIDHIILAGGSALIPGVAALIQEKEGIDTSIADPFRHMQLSNKINREIIEHDAPSLMVVCGLAMRSFDHGKN